MAVYNAAWCEQIRSVLLAVGRGVADPGLTAPVVETVLRVLVSPSIREESSGVVLAGGATRNEHEVGKWPRMRDGLTIRRHPCLCGGCTFFSTVLSSDIQDALTGRFQAESEHCLVLYVFARTGQIKAD